MVDFISQLCEMQNEERISELERGVSDNNSSGQQVTTGLRDGPKYGVDTLRYELSLRRLITILCDVYGHGHSSIPERE
jgi:hypothetical protein